MSQLVRVLLGLMDWFTRIHVIDIRRRGSQGSELGAFHGVPKPAIISGEYDREDLGVILFFGSVSSVYPMSVAILDAFI
jgi:hypothetical protein